MRRFTVVGMFEFGEHENDSGLAMVHIEDAARLLRMPEDSIGGIRLKLEDLDSAWLVAREISHQLDGAYRVRDWSQERGNLFQAVRTEKTVMWVILSLIIAVAAFNIISMLVMVVTDKQADIAILKTMGAHAGTIMRVFVVQGSLIGIIGTALGVVVAFCWPRTSRPWCLSRAYFWFCPVSVRYLLHYRVAVRPAPVRTSLAFAIMSLGMSLLSTLYPAWRASRTDPAEALRYE